MNKKKLIKKEADKRIDEATKDDITTLNTWVAQIKRAKKYDLSPKRLYCEELLGLVNDCCEEPVEDENGIVKAENIKDWSDLTMNEYLDAMADAIKGLKRIVKKEGW